MSGTVGRDARATWQGRGLAGAGRPSDPDGMLVAGIMSGTSVDGIDVAFARIGGSGNGLTVRPVGHCEVPFPSLVRAEVLAVSEESVPVARISQLHSLLGLLFGEAVLEACERVGVPVGEVELVGSHGQTICHHPQPSEVCGRQVRSTLQIGEPACIAQLVGAPVVADFRPADVVAGGDGAPLVPFVDYILFRDRHLGRVALNIGGIANLTAIPPGCAPEQVVAMDTGPGNMVIDQLVYRLTGGDESMDRDGRMASRGTVNVQLLNEWLRDPYYGRPPPKSTGRELFGAGFARSMVSTGLSAETLAATAAHLTATTVLQAIERFVGPMMPVDELVVSGGGWKNPSIMEPICAGLPGTRVRASRDFGVDGDAKEAIAFAVLAYETIHGRPSNLPSATGASREAILGRISQGPPGEAP